MTPLETILREKLIRERARSLMHQEVTRQVFGSVNQDLLDSYIHEGVVALATREITDELAGSA